MDQKARRRAWTAIVVVQDFSLACILSGIIALIMGTDEWIEFGLILVSSFMAIKLFDNVIFSFFDGLVNNSFLRKYLFGSNNAK